jgi:nucleotide-binding universal stress UspA family protein
MLLLIFVLMGAFMGISIGMGHPGNSLTMIELSLQTTIVGTTLNMFHKILVPLDRSSSNCMVFQAALHLATAMGASLMLLHVPSPDDPEAPNMPTLLEGNYRPLGSERTVMKIYQDLWQAYTAKGLEMLQGFAEQATAAGVSVEYSQNPGPAGRVICSLASTIDADLIVIGRRGHSGWNELIVGSVSNYVMHHAPCSVMTVKNYPLAPSSETASSTPTRSVPA